MYFLPFLSSLYMCEKQQAHFPLNIAKALLYSLLSPE